MDSVSALWVCYYLGRRLEGTYMSLRDDMQQALAGWGDAVPENWRGAIIAPNLEANEVIEAQNEEGAYAPYPPLHDAEGARHLFRPFTGLVPTDVRVVVIGQDPYTEPGRATGRSFEDGVAGRISETTRPALRRLVQSAVAPGLLGGPEPWRQLREMLGDPPPRTGRFFDLLQERGVLFVNASWTFTHKNHQSAHKELWRPVTEHLLRQIAAAQGGTVFLLLGREAQGVFRRSIPEPDDFPRAAFIAHPHPTAYRGNTYFNGANPLVSVNQALRAKGEAEIEWWPFP